MRIPLKPLRAWLMAMLSWHVGAAPMSDAELDARVHALSQQLRCLVCQNQTLADSNAELAVDLRRQIRTQLAQGASESAIKDYLVQRYGDFVLYDPPFKPSTWLLWLGPFGFLVGIVWYLRRRGRSAGALPSPPAPLPQGGRGGQDSAGCAPLSRTAGEGLGERASLPTRDNGKSTPPKARPRSRWTTATLSLALPPAAALLYLHLGNPAAVIQGTDAHSLSGEAHAPDISQIEAMVDQLARRLQANPQDANGWSMLARSYTVLERFDDAAAAYARAVALAPDVASLHADYADVLASLNNGSLEGPAMEQIRAALAADPDDPKGLALAASAAAERGDTAEAIGYWQRLYRLLPPDSQTAARVAANLAAAQGAAGTTK